MAGRAKDVDLLSVPAVAKRLGCGVTTVYKLMTDGDLRVVDIAPAGSRRPKSRVRSDDLDDLIDRRTRTTKT